MKKALTILMIGAFTVAVAGAQVTDETTHPIVTHPSGPVTGGLGTVLGDFPAPGGGVPVGLENDGNGDLWLTEIVADTVSLMDTAGTLLGPSFSMLPNTGNGIGVTVDGSGDIRLTDTTDDDVDSYTTAGVYGSSFDVSGETTFPEGITYNPDTGNLYVVDGSGGPGGEGVAEYMPDGTLVMYHPIATGSTDGIAYDPNRCNYWVYDSTTDTVTHYDPAFAVIETFPGTATAGFSTGEGVAVVDDTLYVVAAGAGTVVMFDVTDGVAEDGCEDIGPTVTPWDPSIPTLGQFGLAALILSLLGAGVYRLRKRH